MHLDSFTLLIAGCAMMSLLGLIFVVLWLRDRASPWLVWWGLPIMFGAVGIALFTLPNWETNIGSIIVGNLLRIFAMCAIWQGVRQFFHRPPAYWAMAGICALWVLLCALQPFRDALGARIVAVSVFNIGVCLFVAAEFVRDRTEVLASRVPAALVFCSFAIFMAVRIAIVGVAPFPFGALPVDPLWLGVFLWVFLLHMTFAGVMFLALTMERREAAQRNFAMLDPLTGLMNRRAFADFALRMGRRDKRADNAMALLVLDLDHFKSINDRFGHEVGDRILKTFAEVAEASVRSSDSLYRMGGEEFCFVLPETPLADAIVVAERIRKTFEGRLVGDASATVSIGIAVSEQTIDVDVLLAAADAAVYEAKARGRNRVVVAEPASLLRQAPHSTEQRLTA